MYLLFFTTAYTKENNMNHIDIARNDNRHNIVSLNDWHVPYEDPVAIQVAFGLCDEMQPQKIVVHEMHDFYSISRFDKNPERKNDLQMEIDKVNKYLATLRATCPNSEIIMLKSNHTDRLKRYLWSRAPELHSLRALKLESLLELEKNEVQYKEDLMFRGVLFKHGSIVRQDSSYTAKAEFIKEGCSGVSGHTHRLGIHYITKRGGKYVWVEGGCLCKVDADYIEGTANWQQGVSVVSFQGNTRHFYATVVPIIDKSIMWGDKTITYKKEVKK